MARVSTPSEEPDALWRPVGAEGGADDPLARDGSPVAAVVRRPTIVAHHEVVTGRNRHLAREVALPGPAAAGPDEGLLLALAVEDHVPVDDAQTVAGAGHDTLDEVHVGPLRGRLQAHLARRRLLAAHVVLLGAGRRVEDDHVAHVRVREARADAVDEHALAD